MKSYLLFFIMAVATVASPGPGVILTLSNALLRSGFFNTLSGILGVACGAAVVAGISATSVGLILASSALAFTLMKYLGAAYLTYLGIKLLRAPPLQMKISADEGEIVGNGKPRSLRYFIEGLSLQLTNPKAVFFFMSIFPQLIDSGSSYLPQFSLLALTYSGLVVAIHCVYFLGAKKAKNWMTSLRGGNVVRKTSGAAFIFFGIMLARASR